MANVSGVSSSSYSSSIYGTRSANIISGLVSGLDTESMIEQSVSGYKSKIQSLQQQQTKLTWKQDGIRSITDKLIALSSKYTSYTSKTNLASTGFFTKAVTTTTGGKYADKVSATGQTNSDIKINSVEQLATAARYQVSADDLGLFNVDSSRAAGSAVDWSDKPVSTLAGTMTLNYGTKNSVNLEFGEEELIQPADGQTKAEAMAAAINEKLANEKITVDSREEAASNYIKAEVDGNGKIVFTDAAGKGNSVYVSGTSGELSSAAGLNIITGKSGQDNSNSGIEVNESALELSKVKSAAERLSGKTVEVTLDGETTKISLGDYTGLDGSDLSKKVMADLSSGLKSAFGDKVQLSMEDGALSFNLKDANSGSSLKVTSTAGEALGLGTSGVTNYLNTGKKLSELLGTQTITAPDGTEYTALKGMKALSAVGEVTKKSGKYVDSAGNSVVRLGGTDDAPEYARVDAKGNLLYGMEINGKTVGQLTVDSGLDSVFSAINNSDAGVTVNYSQLSNKLTFTANKTGENGSISFGEGLASALFVGSSATYNKSIYGTLTDAKGNVLTGTDENGEYRLKMDDQGRLYKTDTSGKALEENGSRIYVTAGDALAVQARTGFTEGTYSAGQDAIVNVNVNGVDKKLTRSSNVIDMDGLSVTLKGTFNEGYENGMVYARDGQGNIDKNVAKVAMSTDSQVTFTTRADADTIVDAIKSFVEDVNSIMTETYNAYATMPEGSYDPLTDDDKADMSESAIKTYEEKAKTGLLFGDSDLSRLYSQLRTVLNSSGTDVSLLRDIGLSTKYDGGVTTLSLDEDKLRAMLDSDPSKVREAFSKTMESGYSSNGLMTKMKEITDRFASTSIGNYGILVQKAGTRTKTLTLNDNTLQKQIDRLDNQIEAWTTKMSDKVDYYTTQFTKLEQLMNEMNSQSSTLSSLMGG